MIKEIVTTVIKGFCVGGTMLVPGVSGGSMAMILNVYDELVFSVSSFMKHKRKSIRLLSAFSIGALIGMVILARPLLGLIEKYPMPLMYFFIGAVAGSVPMIYGKAKGRGITWKSVIYPALGISVVLLLSMIPKDFFQSSAQTDFMGMLLLALAGLIGAVAFVLPGISISFLLLVVGLYDETMHALSTLYLPYLLPLGIGMLLGILLCTRLLEKALTRYPQPTYLIIFGFIIGSLVQVFPGLPGGSEVIICVCMLIGGFGIVRKISK